MLRRVAQERRHVQHALDVIRGFAIDGHVGEALPAKHRDGVGIGEIVGEREHFETRRHAIVGRLITELDDLGNHLALRLVQRALFGAEFHERINLVLGEMALLFQRSREDGLRHTLGKSLQQARYRIEQRSELVKDRHAQSRDLLWRA